ncbi:MAG TPA: PAS domain S-box protein, partial [Armatimonadota bacterium]|nr:PAS domain S-box protein [Armatimonadota bacterium]
MVPNATVLDPARLAALRQVALLDTPVDAAFDRLTRLATRLLDAPVSLVTLVDAERQVFKGCTGLPEPWASLRESPLSHSFCQHTLGSPAPLVVDDARRDPCLCENHAIRDLGVIAYLGIPLITSDGHALGAFCVIDHQPRKWTNEQVGLLRDLSASVLTEIELRAAAQEAKIQADRAERESREKVALLESAGEGIYGVDADMRCTFINPAGARLLGYHPEEVLGQRMHPLIHHTRADGAPFPEAECPVVGSLRTGLGVELDDETLWRRDGSSFSAQYCSSPIRDGDRIQGAVVVFHDNTERKRVEAALRRDALLLANVHDSIILTDLDGIITYWNEGATRLFGWEAPEVLGKPYADRYPEPVRAWIAEQIKARGSGSDWDGEWEDYRKDGSRVWIDACVRALTDAAGKPLGILGIARDLTARKQAEHALREAENRYRTIIEQSPFSIQIIAPDGATRMANAAFEALWGVSRAVLVGYNLLQDPQLARKGLLPQIERAFAGETVTLPPVFYDPGEDEAPGRGRWVESFFYPVKDEAGRVR